MQDKDLSLSLVVAVCNEEELLEEFVTKARQSLAKVAHEFEIILVDDGSSDDSRKIEDDLEKKFSDIKIIKLDKNYGLGTAYAIGFKAAEKDIIFNNTVDTFFNMDELPKILPYLKQADALSCYRTNTKSNNYYQKLLTLTNYWLIKFFSR